MRCEMEDLRCYKELAKIDRCFGQGHLEGGKGGVWPLEAVASPLLCSSL